MKSTTILAAATAALMLISCGGETGQDTNNSAVTPAEAMAIDNGADMLDTSADSLVAIEDSGIGNGEMPVAENVQTGEVSVAGNGQ